MTVKTEGTFKPEKVFQAIADIVTAMAQRDGVNVTFTLKSVKRKDESAA